MADTLPEDNEFSSFAAVSDAYSTNFDLFDLGFNYHNGEANDTSTSHGSTSTDSNLFDDVSLDSASWEKDFFATCEDVFPSIASKISPLPSSCGRSATKTPTPSIPKSRRLVHRMRPEGIVISSDQLLALENEDIAPLTAFRLPSHSSPPSTPPATPQTHRTHPNTPSTTNSCRMHRVEKNSSCSRRTSRPALNKPGSSQTMSSAQVFQQQQTPAQSPSFAQWTECLRRLAVESPRPNHAFPISPPPSTRVDQIERTTVGLSHGLGLDIPNGVLGPSFAAAATGFSTSPTQPSTDDIFSSAPNSSSWGFDDGDELFGTKHDSWDFSSTDIHPSAVTSLDLDGLNSLSHPNFDGTLDNGFNTSSDGGLGICFANGDFNSQVFGSSIEQQQQPSETPIPSSVKLPAMPFNTPVSDFGSPALIADLPTLNTSVNAAVATFPYHHQHHNHHPPSMPRKATSNPPTPKHHRRNKSSTSTSARSASGRPSGSTNKLRNPRTPKSASAGGLGFVNFTPEDRNRILTGVAPSGSSKTKARREKEALDRRRKLSEAARRLVIEAGGDIEAVDVLRELSD